MIDFVPLRPLRRLLGPYRGRWWIAGGWAVDLHVGRATRTHHDVEFAIPRDEQATLLAHLESTEPDLTLTCRRGDRWGPWRAEDPPISSPSHQIRIRSVAYAVDAMLNDIDGDTWRYRRDPRVVHPGPLGPPGSPLPPEIVLLYKAKGTRPQDGHDFGHLSPLLNTRARSWLEAALALAHPDHPWRATLGR